LLLELLPPVPQQLLELPLPALQPEDALPDRALFLPLAGLDPPLPPDTNCISSKDKILITFSNQKKLVNKWADYELLVGLGRITLEFFSCVNLKQ
jgi:hypothetical protein